MLPERRFIQPNELRDISFKIADNVLEDKFVPTVMISLFRGGCPISIYMDEYFKANDVNANHVSIRTIHPYKSFSSTGSEITVHGEEYLINILQKDSRVLIVDDIVESGKSIHAVLKILLKKLGDRMPDDIRIASPFIKSAKLVVPIKVNYFLEDTKDWVVFPHELEDLTLEEIGNVFGIGISKMIAHRRMVMNK